MISPLSPHCQPSASEGLSRLKTAQQSFLKRVHDAVMTMTDNDPNPNSNPNQN